MTGFKPWIGRFVSGLHFRFLSLVIFIAALLLGAQLASDTLSELSKFRQQKLTEALGVTNVIARSLEKQFDYIELDDIEKILASVRERGDIQQLTVVDRHKTFFLDGDLMTSPIIAINNSPIQTKALETAKTAFEVTDQHIQVAEPLLADSGGSTAFAPQASPKGLRTIG